MMRWLMGVAMAAITSCSADPGPEPVKPPVPKACELAGQRIRQLECRTRTGLPLWETPDGAPFAEFCRQRLSYGLNLNPQCIARARSCNELEARARGELCN